MESVLFCAHVPSPLLSFGKRSNALRIRCESIAWAFNSHASTVSPHLHQPCAAALAWHSRDRRWFRHHAEGALSLCVCSLRSVVAGAPSFVLAALWAHQTATEARRCVISRANEQCV